MTNEQKYKTAEERVRAFYEWCRKRDCESCELKSFRKSVGDFLICPMHWLTLEAEEEKPEPCPFCGDAGKEEK